ncbi:Diacylglycerol o-acyltransferase [Oopsacas minuta]|uniref:Acyltransferase n=1 Tax=Oopsacas minuta TaxID=111878 RepID=A0AAV7JNZ4_9METZ|nr:Diacylglycerol o-acyltransferase [Oopsacas minuta]
MKHLQISNILGSCCIYIIILAYYLGSSVFILLPFALFDVRYAFLTTIAILLFYRIRFPFEYNGAFEIQFLRRNRFVDFIQKQQSWYNIHTSKLDINKKYMFIGCPHGMLPISWFFFVLHLASVGIYPRPLLGDIIFRLPYVREFSFIFGGANASWKSVKIAADNERSLIILAGSAEEMKYSGKFKDKVIVVKRTGFIKAALQYGYSLVPVMGVGVDDLYHPYVLQWEWFKRMLGYYLFIAIGKFDIIYPRSTEVYNIIGKPIDVVVNTKPSKREIQDLSDLFYQKLENCLEYYNQTNNKNIKLEYIMY